MERKLVYYPEKILRQPANLVVDFGPDLEKLSRNMRRVMHRHQGMGLAAPQVGVPLRLIVVEYTPPEDSSESAIPFTVMINPVIASSRERADKMAEGCLSVPFVEVPVRRSIGVSIKACDLTGRSIKIKAKGLLARIVQHEVDHLDGKLVLDYETRVSPVRRASQVRTIVWGSGSFTVGVLNELRPRLNIVQIVTEPPKPSGRGGTLTPSIAKAYADTLKIPTAEPSDLSDPRFYAYILSLKPDLMVVAAYGRLIPKSVYELPPLGTLNIHPSLLPKYRGASPIQAAILGGEVKTGISIMRLAQGFDRGDIIAQSPYDLTGKETGGDLATALAELGAATLLEILPDYTAGKLVPAAQDSSQASYAPKITPADRWLNPIDGPTLNERKIRAFASDLGAFVMLSGRRLSVFGGHIEKGRLVFDVVQLAGKRPMTWSNFVRGWRQPLQFEPYKDIINKTANNQGVPDSELGIA